MISRYMAGTGYQGARTSMESAQRIDCRDTDTVRDARRYLISHSRSDRPCRSAACPDIHQDRPISRVRLAIVIAIVIGHYTKTSGTLCWRSIRDWVSRSRTRHRRGSGDVMRKGGFRRRCEQIHGLSRRHDDGTMGFWRQRPWRHYQTRARPYQNTTCMPSKTVGSSATLSIVLAEVELPPRRHDTVVDSRQS